MKWTIGSIAVALATALVGGVFSAAPASAAAYSVTGHLLTTYNEAGGKAVFGVATTARKRLTVASRYVYHQHFQKGTVVWSSVSSRTWLNDEMPSLYGINNERIVAGLGDQIFRSADLCHSTRFSKQLLASLLHGGAIIDLRGKTTSAECPDPSLPDVDRYRYTMTGTTDMVTFATKQSDRDSMRRALRRIANTPGNVLIHCHYGKDRTGHAHGHADADRRCSAR